MTAKSLIVRSAVAYARFSSDNQRAESIDAQLADIRAYAAREHYNIIAEYTDEAKTATTDRRPQFQKMISAAESGDFDTVLVFKLDRFSRDRYDFAYYRRKLAQNGVKIVSINENLTDDPESVIMEAVLEGMAEYYSRNLSREVMRKGMLPNARKCQHNGGIPPLGYDVDKDKHYIINEREAESVRLIYSMYLSGDGYSAIVDRLAAEGRVSKQGTKIGKTAVHDILKQEKYTGVYIYNRSASKDADGRRNTHKNKPDDEIIRIEDGMPRIISDETWRAVRKKMDHQRSPESSQRKRVYILSGKIFCGRCGASMSGNTTRSGRNKERYSYYECSGKKNSRSCDMKAIGAEYVETLVINAIWDDILSPDAREKFADKFATFMKARYAAIPEELTECSRRLKELDAGLNNIVSAIEAGAFTSALNDRMKDLYGQREAMELRVKELERDSYITIASKREVIDYLDSFGDIRAASPKEQAAAVRVFVDKIVVNDDDLVITVMTPEKVSRVSEAGIDVLSDSDTVSPPPDSLKTALMTILIDISAYRHK